MPARRTSSSPAPASSQNTPGKTPDFDVVLLGSGLGIYALSRAFHEAYGVVSTVLAVKAPEPMLRSVTCEVVDLPSGVDDAGRLQALLDLAQQRPAGRRTLLLGNTDGDIDFIARHADTLNPHYALRIPSAETVKKLADKAHFAQLCTDLEIAIPDTVVIDFGGEQMPELPHLPFSFPVVAKPAVAEPHVRLRMAGKKKVYFLQNREELLDLIQRLHSAGFQDRFVVQELIPGDDTAMRSITAYRDAQGNITLLAGAKVLLEEHTPDALGRPAAMITADFPEQFAQVRRLLEATNYVGFANADIKEDPRDGSQRFLEINPRIGRNSYYVTGAGANVATFLVADAVENRVTEPCVGVPEILYSIVPTSLILRYMTDPDQRAWVRSVARRRTVNPWIYRAERLWMRAYAEAVRLNHVRKFRRYYPKPSQTGF